MNIDQVRFAKSHDWFDSVFVKPGNAQDEYSVRVWSREVQDNGSLYCRQIVFTDFESLKAWAGY